jgi:chitinase
MPATKTRISMGSKMARTLLPVLIAIAGIAGCAGVGGPSGALTATPTPTPAALAFVFSEYKDVSIGSSSWTGPMHSSVNSSVEPVLQAMPISNTTLTWAFAAGVCGSENWVGVSAPLFATANVGAFVAAGKRYIVSTGGAGNSFTCNSDAGFAKFIATYFSPNMIGVDFDIENGQSQADIDNLVQRVITAQKTYPNMRFSFTVATLGGNALRNLGDAGVMVMRSIKTFGLTNYVINLMTMDYSANPSASACTLNWYKRCDMAASAIQAAKSLHSQFGVPYGQIELTPMIGENDNTNEMFSIEDVAPIVAFAKQNGLAGIHFWSLDRDIDCPFSPSGPSASCSGAQAPLGSSQGSNAGTLGYTNNFIAALGNGPGIPPIDIDYSHYPANLLSTPSMPGNTAIHFSGIDWTAKSGIFAPGPNHWSPDNAWVDSKGFLHLKLTSKNGLWIAPTLFSDQTFGFGTYQFEVIGYPATFDRNVVLGLYSENEAGDEADIEFGTWGGAATLQGHWTVWPGAPMLTNTTYQFNPIYSGAASTQRYTWTSRSIEYESLDGLIAPGDHTGATAGWRFAPANYQARVPQRPQRIGINLWLTGGMPPVNGREFEIVLRAMTFTPEH